MNSIAVNIKEIYDHISSVHIFAPVDTTGNKPQDRLDDSLYGGVSSENRFQLSKFGLESEDALAGSEDQPGLSNARTVHQYSYSG